MASPRNEGFLTEYQRGVLKLATESAAAAVLSSSPKSPTPAFHPAGERQIRAAAAAKAGSGAGRQVRRTHSGKLGRAKKDGAGGKGTWGKLIDTGSDSHLDRKDPNYDSGEDSSRKVTVERSCLGGIVLRIDVCLCYKYRFGLRCS